MPQHWSDTYVGLPYREDFNCAHLAARVRAEVFGQRVDLPVEIARGPLGRAQQIHTLRDAYAARTGSPVDGDGVLLCTRGRWQHIGLLCVISGVQFVLHNVQGSSRCAGGVVRQRLSTLSNYGYAVEGFYKWK